MARTTRSLLSNRETSSDACAGARCRRLEVTSRNAFLRNTTAAAGKTVDKRASCRGLPADQVALALDAPTVARQVAIAADDAVARNRQGDRVGSAGAGDRTG